MEKLDILIILLSLIIGWISTIGFKSQWVRLIDIFIYGPFLIYVGMQIDNKFIRAIMLFMGATTISYNLKNLIKY
jgi:hypothetical protein